MENITQYQQKLIDRHNEQMDVIYEASRQSGLSRATLFYAAHFGIWGIGWEAYRHNLNLKKKHKQKIYRNKKGKPKTY